jgi:uncharacterized protein (UPF0210 family)
MHLQNVYDIMQTIRMIQQENLDIRTITMGISLRDCCHGDINKSCNKVYDKITTYAKDLVKTGEFIEKKYGIPIVNKRISVTPISLVAESCDTDDYVKYALVLDRAAQETGVNFIGGYSALLHKGYTKGDHNLVKSIPEALSVTDRVCSSVNVATTRAGINMDAVAQMCQIIKTLAKNTGHIDSLGCAKLVVFANAVEDNPFMAGAFHGIGEGECVINVGVSGPGVVSSAISRVGDCDFSVLADTIKKTAFKVTRMGQLVAQEASKMLNVPFGIVDYHLPLPRNR